VAVQSVFTTQTPTDLDATDSVYYTLATRIRTAVAGRVLRVRYWMPSTPPTSITAGLFSRTSDAAGSLLGTGSFGSTAAGWQTADLPGGGLDVAAGADLYAAVWTDRYVFTGAFFGADVVTGDLTAPADDAVTPARNGRFKIGETAPTYPDSGGGTCYFVDVEFAAATTAVLDGSTPAVQSALTAAITSTPGVTVSLAGAVRLPTASGRCAVPAVARDTGSWWSIRGIIDEARARDEDEAERRRDPVDCPHCESPLVDGGPDGTIRGCSFCGWRDRW
jgi:hypothetical protein